MENTNKVDWEIKEIKVGCEKIKAVIVPMPISDTQVLLLDDINNVMAVAYVQPDGHITWKFGKPHKSVVGEVEKALRCI